MSDEETSADEQGESRSCSEAFDATAEKTIRDRMAELVDEGLVLDRPAEPLVDPAPLGYIEVRAWKWRTVDGFVIRDGYTIGSRPRVEADGDAEYVVFKTPRPKPTNPDGTPMLEVEEKAEWPKWGEPGPKVDPRFVEKYGRTERGWNRWSLGRNSGCMRADGSIEP